jgi:hypothetical protein
MVRFAAGEVTQSSGPAAELAGFAEKIGVTVSQPSWPTPGQRCSLWPLSLRTESATKLAPPLLVEPGVGPFAATQVLLAAAAFLLTGAETLFDSAAQALVPALVDPPNLERANARLYAGQVITNQFTGPPVGSILFAIVPALPFAVDAGSYAIAALLIAVLPRNAAVVAPPPAGSNSISVGPSASSARCSMRAARSSCSALPR